MFGAERRDLFSGGVHDDAGHVGGLLGRRSTFYIDSVREAGDQIAAFGVDSEVDGLQKDRDGFSRGLYRAAILDDHRKHAFAACDRRWQLEIGAGIAGAVDGGGAFPDLGAIDARAHRNFRSGRNTAFGALNVEVGGDGVAGAIAVTYKNNLALETRSPVSADVELAFGREVAPGIRNANCVLASSLASRDVPRKSHHTVRNRRNAGSDPIPLGASDLEGGGAVRALSSHWRMAVRTEENRSDIDLFAGAVNRFIRCNVSQIAFDSETVGRGLRDQEAADGCGGDG
ncbi:MAG TPA: hypothetical protein VKE70_26855 [Candidatus Solibacter sp.]|nr:hypothetical protein [Candidatus Solibacter sp.]